MGFNVTALAQKARTQTIIVDSDLDMGQYDVIATDVKGDTAEFSEFVGGVGNFESGLISGGLDVGDILHAESSMQIDGDLVVEGAINNVNITNEGAINTAKSITATGGFKGNVTGSISGGTVAGSTGTFSGAVTGASFNGVILKTSGIISVSSISDGAKIYIPKTYAGYDNGGYILPYHPNVRYSGSIILCNDVSGNQNVTYSIGDNTDHLISVGTTPYTLTFSNVPYLCLAQYGYTIYFRELKLT